VGTSGDDSLSGTRFTALLWMEGIKALAILGVAIYLIGWEGHAAHQPNLGFGGAFFEILDPIIVAGLLVLGGFHFLATWLLARRKAPLRFLLVVANILEIVLALSLLGISLLGIDNANPIWAMCFGICAFELYLVLSERARIYWSSDSDSSASSTSG
jgi:hypothetical protein